MAKPAVFTWPAPSVDSIATLQPVVFGTGGFVLNGSLVPPGTKEAVFPGISRTVTITSAFDISPYFITVEGTYNGAFQTETIAGPNASTVETTNLFDTVTAVYPNSAIFASSVGTGTTGHTNWFNHNYHATVVGFTLQVVVTGTINYTFQTTLDDVNANSNPTAFAPIDGTAGSPGFPVDLVSQTSDVLVFANEVFRFSNILINSSTDGTLVATFLQQGIT